jgi:hypothetical protein
MLRLTTLTDILATPLKNLQTSLARIYQPMIRSSALTFLGKYF